MNLVQTFLTGFTLSLILRLVIVRYLKTPLTNLLIDVCGAENRAKFWTNITNLSYVLMALLMSILNRPKISIDPIFQISRQLSWTLCGLIITLIFVSMAISNFVYQFNKQNLLTLSISKKENDK